MTEDRGSMPGLAWPDHDSGPTPPPNYGDQRDRETRRPLAPWDRIKLLTLFLGSFLFLYWGVLAADPLSTNEQAMRASAREYGWLLLLAALEAVRQLHYLISERSSGYHRFWTHTVFGGFERRTGRMNDWTRYRLSRVLRWLFVLLIVDLVLARMLRLPPAVALFQLPVVIWDILPLVLRLAFGFFFIMFQFVGLFWFLSRGGIDTYMPEDIKTRFRDVWGQDHVLDKIKESIFHLEQPDLVEQKGGYLPGGILLWGAPGTGKTLMAEAVAGETGKPFVFVDPGAFINMFMGVGILKVKSLFRKLRKLALRYGGVIVFFDEADSLGSRGAGVAGTGGSSPPAGSTLWAYRPECHGISYMSEAASSLLFSAALSAPDEGPGQGLRDRMMMGMGMGGGGMGTLQALLTEMSGLKKPRGFANRYVRRALGMRPKPPPKYRILVMMATNMPTALDPALLRPGRIDRVYKVGYPSKKGRVRTYEGYLSKVRHSLSPADVDKLATITPYATGASIKDLVNEALIQSIRDGREWITWEDIVRARLLKSLGPPEGVEYIERERHATAIHEACHAVVAYRIRRHLTIDLATIEKGQDYLGMVASIPLEEQFTRWRSEYEADIMVALAALIGEKMFFEGDSSSGVSADLQGATTLAMFMEGYWGMGSTIGSHSVVKRPTGFMMSDSSATILETELGRRIEDKLRGLMQQTEELLRRNRREILAVAHALEAHKTLTGDDVVAVIEGTMGPLVDGRPYADREFMRAAEDYHQRVVDAHRGHGRVDVPLPVLTAPQAAASQRWDPGSGDGDGAPR